MPSLKELAIKGSILTFAGYGTSQVLRLGSNLILTRLLFPEVFGLSALITTFLVGLQMFSDLGIGPSIIQNERGDEPVFLNTAWTIQVIRGLALWICSCISAWPFASFYGEPQLGWLITVSGLTAFIAGFNSTGLYTANRHLRILNLTLLEVGSQIGAISLMIVWAIISPSVWALVGGGLAGAFLKMLASHLWLSEFKHKFAWERHSMQSLVRFGRWIFFSTILGFFINQGDRLILGKLFTIQELGVYSIGSMLAKNIEQLYQQVSNKILFPVFVKIKHLSKQEIRERVSKIRKAILATFLPPLWIFVLFGQNIVNFLFDFRYHEAGWIFQVLAAGSIPVVITSIGPFYLALGKSKTLFSIVALRALYFFLAVIAGYMINGVKGLIFGIAAHNILFYLTHLYLQKKHSIWIAKLDFIGITSSIFVIGLGYYLIHGS